MHSSNEDPDLTDTRRIRPSPRRSPRQIVPPSSQQTSSNSSELKKADELLAQRFERLEELEKRILATKSHLETKHKELKDEKTAFEAEKAKHAKVFEQISIKEKELSSLFNSLKAKGAQLAATEATIDRKRKELTEQFAVYEQRRAELHNQLNALDERRITVQQELFERESKTSEREYRVSELEKRLQAKTTDLGLREKDAEHLQSQLRELEQRLTNRATTSHSSSDVSPTDALNIDPSDVNAAKLAIETERKLLAVKLADLQAREKKLKQLHDKIAEEHLEIEQQLEAKSAELEQQMENWKPKQDELQSREEALIELEKEFIARDDALKSQMEQLKRQEEAFAKRVESFTASQHEHLEELEAASQKLKRFEKSLLDRESELQKREQKVAHDESEVIQSIESLTKDREEFMKLIEDKHEEWHTTDSGVKQQLNEIKEERTLWEEQRMLQEKALSEREEKMREKEKELADKENRLNESRKALKLSKRKLIAKERDLAKHALSISKLHLNEKIKESEFNAWLSRIQTESEQHISRLVEQSPLSAATVDSPTTLFSQRQTFNGMSNNSDNPVNALSTSSASSSSASSSFTLPTATTPTKHTFADKPMRKSTAQQLSLNIQVPRHEVTWNTNNSPLSANRQFISTSTRSVSSDQLSNSDKTETGSIHSARSYLSASGSDTPGSAQRRQPRVNERLLFGDKQRTPKSQTDYSSSFIYPLTPQSARSILQFSPTTMSANNDVSDLAAERKRPTPKRQLFVESTTSQTAEKTEPTAAEPIKQIKANVSDNSLKTAEQSVGNDNDVKVSNSMPIGTDLADNDEVNLEESFERHIEAIRELQESILAGMSPNTSTDGTDADTDDNKLTTKDADDSKATNNSVTAEFLDFLRQPLPPLPTIPPPSINNDSAVTANPNMEKDEKNKPSAIDTTTTTLQIQNCSSAALIDDILSMDDLFKSFDAANINNTTTASSAPIETTKSNESVALRERKVSESNTPLSAARNQTDNLFDSAIDSSLMFASGTLRASISSKTGGSTPNIEIRSNDGGFFTSE